MEYTAIAQWLNTFFAGYDSAILSSLSKLADAAGSFLTPVLKFITLLGEKGLMMFIIALVCMCFARTRKLGVCIFGAVCCGALITNIILKDMVARPRPFEFSAQFYGYWMSVGSPAEDGFSFPSGHVTAATAGVAALCFVEGRKWIAPSVIWVVLMGVSRNYLMAHFPSDVLFAIIIGLFSAFVAYLITKAIFNYVEDND
ncbi:MAG: phosphatase PAP2 family protein, partial [Oscillospiraceae bacterium]|nr:phosphatase PAP2 family protein [Oscillospiraceae bacterium]